MSMVAQEAGFDNPEELMAQAAKEMQAKQQMGFPMPEPKKKGGNYLEHPPSPEQFFDNSRAARMSADQLLVFAVITQAIIDLRFRAFRKSALQWIIESGRRVLGFDWCCEALAIDEGRLRAAILDYWRRRRRKEVPEMALKTHGADHRA